MESERDKLIKIFYFIWLGIVTLILTPLAIYYCVQFWRLKDNVITFDRRYPKYVTMSLIAMLFHVLILRPIADLPEILSMEINNNLSTLYFRLVLYYTIHIIYIMLLIRAWLLYISYTVGEHLIRLSWQQQIVNDDITLPWSLKYKWLSNIKYISLFASIYWIIVVITVHIAFNFAESHQDFASTASYIIIVILSLIIAYKIRKCKDDLFIHLELKYIGIVFLPMVPMTFILFQVLDRAKLLALTFTVFVDICLFVMAMINTKYIIYKYNQQIRRMEIGHQVRLNDIDSVKFMDVKIEDILQIKDGFDLFAHHLIKEFSIEHLTFLFEIMQLKYDVIKNRLITINHIDIDIDIGIMFKIGEYYMDKIKRSNFNFITKDDSNVYERLSFIMYNYIDLYAPYSINISGQIRNKLLNEMSNIMNKYHYMKRRDSVIQRRISIMKQSVDLGSNIELQSNTNNNNNNNNKDDSIISIDDQKEMIKYLKLMDIAIEAIIRMLASDSYHRFIQTKQFEKLIEAHPELIK